MKSFLVIIAFFMVMMACKKSDQSPLDTAPKPPEWATSGSDTANILIGVFFLRYGPT